MPLRCIYSIKCNLMQKVTEDFTCTLSTCCLVATKCWVGNNALMPIQDFTRFLTWLSYTDGQGRYNSARVGRTARIASIRGKRKKRQRPGNHASFEYLPCIQKQATWALLGVTVGAASLALLVRVSSMGWSPASLGFSGNGGERSVCFW